VISVQALTRRFGAAIAIEDLSFTLERGEVVGFLGPNGAGKTTTMRILTGYLPASSGSASVCGLDVLRQSLEVRKKIGYLPEAVPLYREHRVAEMLEFQARLHGMRRRDWRLRIPEVLERVGIADRARSLIGSLSRGQRQRVGLAVALLPNPEVLILDEPTSGLDPLQRLEVRTLLRQLAREHTVLLSSHILPEIEAVCPRVIILNRGRIAADGTPEQLVSKLGYPSFVRLEAVIGADVETALRLLRGIRGVKEVRDDGRLGIHHRFVVRCEEDLREDVGALAAQRGWALRELSWNRPTLEDLFARIALDFGPSEVPMPRAGSESDAAPPSGFVALGELAVAPAAAPVAAKSAMRVLSPFEQPPSSVSAPVATGAIPLGTKTPPRVVYNLNPFDMGASRDLSKPKPIDVAAPDAIVPPARAKDDAPSACDERQGDASR
jgi:ABC-2 type transport system ATP-binding protein